MVSRWVAVLAAAAALMVAGDADARRRRAKPKASKHHHRHHRVKAHAQTQPRKPSNMPDGWSWPPSKEMVAAGKACTAQLDALGVTWKRATGQPKIATPITVPAMVFGGVKAIPTFRKPPFVMDCQLALALTIHGKALYDRGVRELRFSRIYGYTPVRTGGKTLAALSRHALGLAIDVREIVDDAGHKGVVLGDYLAGDPLLLAVETYLNDSGGFRMVLTPRNDPQSHYDHFHVEARADYRVPTTPARPPS